MVTETELQERARAVRESADLRKLLAHLEERAKPLIQQMPSVPEQKALLSVDGGVCPEDGTQLTFDPWSPSAHRCPQCGKSWSGERHDRSWARQQHLWLAERAAHLAALGALGDGGPDDRAAAARAREILQAYAQRYWRYPNVDNLLGPSRLFFSTYLESLWTCNYLAAATILRAAGQLDDATARGVNQVAEEAATIIGEYDEGFSNRQTWNNAALTAVAVWFEDEELAQRVIEGDTGLIAHLMRGYGRDGMWYEGENYHLFALRGMLTGAAWARLAGVDIAGDERLAARLQAALLAPGLTALPDLTFPARKDAQFDIALAQPSFVDSWEVGLAQLGGRDTIDTAELSAWLRALYAARPAPWLIQDYYLHDAPLDRQPHAVVRTALSWWSLLAMQPDLPEPAAAWEPHSVLMPSQGLAILRGDGRYVSVECGAYGGGHGHPDRLHLTLFADGVLWLADPGTGRYVTPDLFWYRSTLAHNAPRRDDELDGAGDAACECFDEADAWGWVRGRFGGLHRMTAHGPRYIVDVVDFTAGEDHTIELPWHFAGSGGVESAGRWKDGELTDPFVTRVQGFVPALPGEAIVIRHEHEGAHLAAHLVVGGGELLEMEGPGRPGSRERVRFYVARARGRNVRFVTVLEPGSSDAAVQRVQVQGDTIEVTRRGGGIDRHRFGRTEWIVEQENQPAVVLRGAREEQPAFVPMLEIDPPTPVQAPAFRVGAPPPLDGTLEGFELSEPIELVLEDQYRRSEDPYPGPDEFSATAHTAWDERALYLGVEVTKPDVCLRAAGKPPANVDNEPDDIHSDGLQLYLAPRAGASDASSDGGRHDAVGYLIVPDDAGSGVRARVTSDTRNGADAGAVVGGWRRTPGGYCVTVAVPWPSGVRPHAGAHVAFDLIVNEMLPGRTRRTGQLVWSGGGGWIWLRGDRQDPARFGMLELVG